MQLVSGVSPDRTHGILLSYMWTEATHMWQANKLYVRTHTKVPMDDQAAYSTRMRAWHRTKGEKQMAGERRMGNSYEGDFEDRTSGFYFPSGTSEYQSSACVSRRNMRADSHGLPCHQRLNRSYHDRNIFITII